VKSQTQPREDKPEEALKTFCLHHGKIRGKNVKLSGRKGIYSRKKHTDTKENNNTRNRQLGSRSPQQNSSAKDNTNEMEKHTETLI
jgi:hypothetical protein